MPIIQSFKNQRQMDCHKFKLILIYMGFQSAKTTEEELIDKLIGRGRGSGGRKKGRGLRKEKKDK